MDLIDALTTLRRRWVVVLLCLLAGLLGGYDLGHSGSKTYKATAQCLINLPASGNISELLAGSQLSSNLVQTYANLVTSQSVTSKAVSLQAGQGALHPVRQLSASVVSGTDLINISATAADPQLAELAANAGARALVSVVAQLQGGIPDKITVDVTSAATLPTSPVSPRPKLDLFVGLVLGLLAGLAVASILEALDRTVKSVSDGNAALKVPLVGLIPKRRSAGLVTQDSLAPEGEPYRSLRTAVRFLDPDRPLRSILVTSPASGDGKTVTAANLAAALAQSGETVIAVDADLRVPRLSDVFGLERSVGLTSLIVGSADLDDVVQQWSPRLSVLASGPLPPNPSEILGSQLVTKILGELGNRADVLIIDAPPVLPVADALALATQVDGVIVVLRHGATLRPAAAEVSRRLEAIGANVLGYVLNAVPRTEAQGFYTGVPYAAYGDLTNTHSDRWWRRRSKDPAPGPTADDRPVGRVLPGG